MEYNLRKDIESGAIEVISPNNGKVMTWDVIERSASLHSTSILSYCDSSVDMARMNYCRDFQTGNWNNEVRKKVEKWQKYYQSMKSRKKYKCKDKFCGWTGRIGELAEGMETEYSCPECNTDIN